MDTQKMWSVSIFNDPLVSRSHVHRPESQSPSSNLSSIMLASTAVANVFQDQVLYTDFQAGGRGSRVALADFVARAVAEQATKLRVEIDNSVVGMEPLDQALLKTRRRKANVSVKYPPYVLKRSDIWCSEDERLHINFRMKVHSGRPVESSHDEMVSGEEKKSDENLWEAAAKSLLSQLVKSLDTQKIMEQVACLAMQERLRSKLKEIKAVAFAADDSIMPRKSGTSDAPMASPPAVPFKAPQDSSMSQKLEVDMGTLAKYLPTKYFTSGSTTACLRGLVVPAGVTLICGGGYHGKSTLLQAIAAGVYNKIPGDGREYCVSVPDAVSVRAEDGRYVNNCNISAFISNLPTPPGVTKALDTTHFGTRDSSGSTSQAANVSEAIEMGATAMLVDEDISAANFMARDGRMRSLVMDESITPLLYRVNGLYNSKGISSIVVVGGVGDWLDVPHQVILLDKYVASDATKKAASISYQFSYGHVQYAGRGVVHRLEWERSGTPTPRRPIDSFSKKYAEDVIISVLDGGHAVSLHRDEDTMEEDGVSDVSTTVHDDDEEGCIEASRLEQLLGRKQLFGCALCILWILQTAPKHPMLGILHLLQKLDERMDQGGLLQILEDVKSSSTARHLLESKKWQHLVQEVGFVHRPRKFEIGQALTRMFGIEMEEIPVEEDDSEAAAKREAERKKQELLKIWANRRTKS